MHANLSSMNRLRKSAYGDLKSLALISLAQLYQKTAPALCLVALLASCAEQQKYNAAGLASVRSVQVNASLTAGQGSSTNAMPRGQRAGSGAVGGAMVGASFWASDPFLLAVAFVAPVVVLTTMAVGGVVGGVAGAATGISASEEQIAAAISVLEESFEPAKHQNQFANTLAKSLEAQLSSTSTTCFSTRQNRHKCRRSGGSGHLEVSAEMGVVASKSDGGAGGLDIVSNIFVRSKPSQLLHPECLGWMHRTRAGNLMKLAQNGGKLFQIRLQQVLSEIARELHIAMFEGRPSTDVKTPASNKSIKAEKKLANWTKVACR